jgi:hypothetical protein
MVASYSEIGKNAREVLLGGREGLYQFDQKLALSTKTADGVSLALSAINKGEKADLSLKSSYKWVEMRWGLAGDLAASMAFADPSFRCNGHDALPWAVKGHVRINLVAGGPADASCLAPGRRHTGVYCALRSPARIAGQAPRSDAVPTCDASPAENQITRPRSFEIQYLAAGNARAALSDPSRAAISAPTHTHASPPARPRARRVAPIPLSPPATRTTASPRSSRRRPTRST